MSINAGIKTRIANRNGMKFAVEYMPAIRDIPNCIIGVSIVIGGELHHILTMKKSVRDDLIKILKLKNFQFSKDYFMTSDMQIEILADIEDDGQDDEMQYWYQYGEPEPSEHDEMPF